MIRLAGIAAAFVAVTCAATPASAAVELAGETTIVASSSGVTDVDVRAPVRLSTAIDKNPTISVQGDGLVNGFVLEQSTPTSLGPYLAAFRVRRGAGCDGPCGDAFASYLSVYHNAVGSGSEVEIAPGRYRLGVLAPGGTVTITLRPAGATGAVTVTELTPTPAAARVLPRLDDGSVPNTTRHGAAAALASRGLMFYAQAAHYETAKVASERQFCDYAGEPTAPDAYGPFCPGGGEVGRFGPGFVAAGPYTEYMTGVVRVSAGGTYGLGGNVTSVSGRPTVGAVGAWLPLYPPAQQGSAPPGRSAPPAGAPPGTAPPAGAPQSAVTREVSTSTRRVRAGRLIVGSVRRRGKFAAVTVRCAAARRCSGVARTGKLSRRFSIAAGRSLTLRLRSRRAARVDVRWKVAGGASGRVVRRVV